ncbi:MAG: lytic transglycosylase domain-containing protein [Firmicutes bacterium]|nr:lytic transglycosylase domain-containing protein [Bacillota bacterium]
MINHKYKKRLLRLGVLLLLIAAALLVLNSPWYLRRMYPFPYREMIIQHSRESGLDPLLVAAMIQKESGFDPGAVSKKGAIGLMQVMPDTGCWVAGKLGVNGYTPEMLTNPDFNLRVGCWYLRYLGGEYQGDWVRVLAAYNAGIGNVQQWMANGTWTGTWETRNAIPFIQTRTYLAEVAVKYSMYDRIYRCEVGGVPAVFP